MNDPFDIIQSEELEFQKRTRALETLWVLFQAYLKSWRPVMDYTEDLVQLKQTLAAALVLAETSRPQTQQFTMINLIGISHCTTPDQQCRNPLLAILHYYMLYMPTEDLQRYQALHSIPIYVPF